MRLEWSALASEDRDDIFDYIEADNPSAAIGIDDRIGEQIGYLSRHPELGRPGIIKGTRELVIAHTPYRRLPNCGRHCEDSTYPARRAAVARRDGTMTRFQRLIGERFRIM